ncbi:hypothetical protein RRG08_008315 [Elysia crispata]|uniref:Uncharacterized protein n=1 Tax=Elysia crispata TaxID=231223 RepID=A0AAE1DJW2_9GAST|nr:hypothetical protein RRG08_008315 [Elysia crispata]
MWPFGSNRCHLEPFTSPSHPCGTEQIGLGGLHGNRRGCHVAVTSNGLVSRTMSAGVETVVSRGGGKPCSHRGRACWELPASASLSLVSAYPLTAHDMLVLLQTSSFGEVFTSS